ncbi:2Fe-2S iron-sulfur cluster binding domain-containing protein [Bdellovibrio svalbardensis]|uniref:2Fe-2S iron-sulfur cluster binding domain-containing protein n=1 Tax=Bdellovibrio svalbardensis TaxID=2972972 RepID=A0ABT6DEX6_9BACT|nr:2Fe-2S iron-sulfur cluster binding domain-containing protein [Bdellovibrio svalbardensis]MDG0815392.1 2Fe-2S iron-sulfur cluster binding domain-containing protein [Bdellovibrio svalbardensis]
MKIQFILGGVETEVEAESGRNLLDIALVARLRPPYSCLEGHCGTCEAFIEHGETSEDKTDTHIVRTCQAIPKSDSVRVNYDKVEPK